MSVIECSRRQLRLLVLVAFLVVTAAQTAYAFYYYPDEPVICQWISWSAFGCRDNDSGAQLTAPDRRFK